VFPAGVSWLDVFSTNITMILPVVQYGDPVLRQKGSEIREVTAAIRRLAQDMLETMTSAKGVGLAAQQVGEAVQMTVLDVRESDRPSQLFLGVREVAIEEMMPLVLLNPRIRKHEGEDVGQEGCLSFPKLYLDVRRAQTIHVSAMDLQGRPLQFTATGLLSRAIQHELDHLNGILFIDRVDPKALDPVRDQLKSMITAGAGIHLRIAGRRGRPRPGSRRR